MSYTQEQLSKMSDLDIEIAMAKSLGLRNVHERGGMACYQMQLGGSKAVQYCSDWSLTGPLMVENSMRLERIGHIWYAERFVSCSGTRHIASNENPLRAICEVILMMGKV